MNDQLKMEKFFFDSGKVSEELATFGDVAQHFPSVVFTYDPREAKVQYFNKRFVEFYSTNDDEIERLENPLRQLMPESVVEMFSNFFQSGPQTFTVETKIKRSDGLIPVRIQASVLRRGLDRKPEIILFFVHDISQEVNAQEEACQIRKLVHETEEMLEYGTWTLDLSTDMISMTPGLLRLLGHPSELVASESPKSFYLSHAVNGYKDGLSDMIDQSVASGNDFDYEYVIQSQSGERKTVVTKGKAIKAEDGKVIKIICITRDLSALRNIEKEQERHIRDLNRSNKELEEFAYIASHDLQEPLRKISMFTERLKSKFLPSLDKDNEMLLDRIMAASTSMRTLIDNLLEFSRINRSSHNFVSLDLQVPLDQAIADLELKIEETGSVIKVFGMMPTLECVEAEMKQLFSNLLSNSIKFRRSGKPAEIAITSTKCTKDERKALRLSTQRTFYKIEFTDKGIGFETEYAERIFQIFQRLHGKAEYPGSGIGLAICKKIVENHNGVIYAQSVLDEGATFAIVLPEKQF